MKKTVWETISKNVLSLGTIATGLVALILSDLGLIDNNVISNVILIVLCLLATSEIIETKRELEKLEHLLFSSNEHIIESLDGVKVTKLETVDAYYGYLLAKINTTKKCWDDMGGLDINFAKLPMTASRRKFYNTFDKIEKQNKIRIRFMAIFSSEEHLTRIEKLIRNSSNGDFSVGYYSSRSNSMPLLEWTIIDQEEIVIGYYNPAYAVGNQVYLSIKHPKILKLFSGYYDNLWYESEKLKEGRFVYEEQMNNVRTSLQKCS